MRPIEQYLADWLQLHAGAQHRMYRRKCLLLWKERYGEEIARKAHSLAKGLSDGRSEKARHV